MYSLAAILEWLNVSAIEVIPKWRETIMRGYSNWWEIYSKVAGDNERLLKRRRA
jgi:hypothetical protein